MYRIVASSESSDLGREAWTPRHVGTGGKGGGVGDQQRRPSTRGSDAVPRFPGPRSKGAGAGAGGGGGLHTQSRPSTSGGLLPQDDGEFGKSLHFGRELKALTPTRAVPGRKSRQNWEPFTRFHVEREHLFSRGGRGGGGERPTTSSGTTTMSSKQQFTRRQLQHQQLLQQDTTRRPVTQHESTRSRRRPDTLQHSRRHRGADRPGVEVVTRVDPRS